MTRVIRCRRALGLAAVLWALPLSASRASAGLTAASDSTIRVRAASRDTTRLDGGGVLTIAFMVTNTGDDAMVATPALSLPRGWSAVMGTASVTLQPHTTDTWLVSLAVPTSTRAGPYAIHALLAFDGGRSGDSVLVRVIERRALEILPLDVPGWVIAGGRYAARFLVRNRGNVSADVRMSGVTSRGTRAQATPASATLAPGASVAVDVDVAVAATFARSTDDVLELTATDQQDPGVVAVASGRTTLIPPGSVNGDRYATIPATLAIRSIGTASGVSPVMLAGGGLLNDDRTRLTFSLQAPVGRQSPYGFGERDEYYANLQGRRFAARLGDNVFGFSPLTMSGTLGTGAEFTTTRGAMTAGAYAQQGRWIPGIGTEEGASLGAKLSPFASLDAVFVARQPRHAAPVLLGSAGGEVRLGRAAVLRIEGASSDSVHQPAFAGRARVSGVIGDLSYDAGVLKGDDAFAGPARGMTVQDGVLTARVFRHIAITAAGGVHLSPAPQPIGDQFRGRLATGTVSASYDGRFTLEYGWLSRRDDAASGALSGTQQGLRATTVVPLGRLSVTGGAERGTVDDNRYPSPHAYTLLSLALRGELGERGTLSVHGARNFGHNLSGAGDGVLDAGASALLRLPFSLTFALSASAQRATLGILNGSGAWFSQTDARIDYTFANASALGLRARVWQNPFLQGSSDSRAIYLEYRRPLRIPVGRSQERGRVVGRVVDAESGAPIVGVAVRVGDQAAVTDRDGRAALRGLEPAVYHVALDATGTVAGALLVGDAIVDMRTASTTPATFSVAVARGAQLRVLVRRLGLLGGTVSDRPDSLVHVGLQPDVLLALEGERDTLYATSDDQGRVDFGRVPPGTWTLAVRPCELPEHHVFEKERVQLSLLPGEKRDVELRVVPQRRAVTFMKGEEVLKVKPVPQADKPPIPPKPEPQVPQA